MTFSFSRNHFVFFAFLLLFFSRRYFGWHQLRTMAIFIDSTLSIIISDKIYSHSTRNTSRSEIIAIFITFGSFHKFANYSIFDGCIVCDLLSCACGVHNWRLKLKWIIHTECASTRANILGKHTGISLPTWRHFRFGPQKWCGTGDPGAPNEHASPSSATWIENYYFFLVDNRFDLVFTHSNESNMLNSKCMVSSMKKIGHWYFS